MESLCVDFVWSRGVVWTLNIAKCVFVYTPHRSARGNEKVDRKESVVHVLSQHGVLDTIPHVQGVMLVLLARLTCTRFSLASLSVHAGSRNVLDCTDLLFCVLTLYFTMLPSKRC